MLLTQLEVFPLARTSSKKKKKKTNLLAALIFRKGLSGSSPRCIDASKANCRSLIVAAFVHRVDNAAGKKEGSGGPYDRKGFLRVLALSTMAELLARRGSNGKYPKSYLPFPWSYPSAPLFFSSFFSQMTNGVGCSTRMGCSFVRSHSARRMHGFFLSTGWNEPWSNFRSSTSEIARVAAGRRREGWCCWGWKE